MDCDLATTQNNRVTYGIVFNHPCDRSRGVNVCVDCDYLTGKRTHKRYINIEVNDLNFNEQLVLDFLNFHYRSAGSLMDLQECGTIFELKKSYHLCDSELSRFKNTHKGWHLEQYVDRDTGNITWYAETKNSPHQKLEIPLYCCDDLEELINKDGFEYGWDYIMIHDLETRTFKSIKLKEC